MQAESRRFVEVDEIELEPIPTGDDEGDQIVDPMNLMEHQASDFSFEGLLYSHLP